MPFPESADSNAPPTELDRLRVAMAVQVARQIADADGILDLAEVEHLARAFPDPWMRRCGFLDEHGQLNADVERWAARARAELPTRLSLSQKLDMIGFFHDLCLADDELHARELDILTDVARRLHVPVDAFRNHLAQLVADVAPPPVRGDQPPNSTPTARAARTSSPPTSTRR